jgi:hypothetical protein
VVLWPLLVPLGSFYSNLRGGTIVMPASASGRPVTGDPRLIGIGGGVGIGIGWSMTPPSLRPAARPIPGR